MWFATVLRKQGYYPTVPVVGTLPIGDSAAAARHEMLAMGNILQASDAADRPQPKNRPGEHHIEAMIIKMAESKVANPIVVFGIVINLVAAAAPAVANHICPEIPGGECKAGRSLATTMSLDSTATALYTECTGLRS